MVVRRRMEGQTKSPNRNRPPSRSRSLAELRSRSSHHGPHLFSTMAALAFTLAVLAGDRAAVGFVPSHSDASSAVTVTSIHARRRPRARPQLLLASLGGAPSKGGNSDNGPTNDGINNDRSTTSPSWQSTSISSKEERRRQSRNLSDARATCPFCRRPPASCVCAALPPNGRKITLPHVDILILQHPSEFRRKHVSTVPLVPLVLENVKISVGREFDDAYMLRLLNGAETKGQTPLLLFPAPDAITLEDSNALEQLQSRSEKLRCIHVLGSEEDESAIDDDNLGAFSATAKTPEKFLLILIDGTWTQAGSMVRKSSPLLLKRCLPIQFRSTEKSQQSLYHSMRKQPDAHCLSTLEACSRTLGLLEQIAAESFKKHETDPKKANELEKSGTSLANDAAHHLHSALEILVQTQLEFEKESILANRSKVRDHEKLQAKWERGS